MESPSLEILKDTVLDSLLRLSLLEQVGVGPDDLQRSPPPQPFRDSAIPECILRARSAGADDAGPNKILYHLNSQVCSVSIRTFHCGVSTQLRLINPSSSDGVLSPCPVAL